MAEIVVVGAGMAGLKAALRLGQADRLADGNQAFADGVVDRLDDVRLLQPVVEIVWSDEGVDVGTASESHVADAVVVAVPLPLI